MKTSVPPELFGDAVMILEFLNTFGPLFNIREVIGGGGITFGNQNKKAVSGLLFIKGNFSFFRSY